MCKDAQKDNSLGVAGMNYESASQKKIEGLPQIGVTPTCNTSEFLYERLKQNYNIGIFT
jgi:hypothetical protein